MKISVHGLIHSLLVCVPVCWMLTGLYIDTCIILSHPLHKQAKNLSHYYPTSCWTESLHCDI